MTAMWVKDVNGDLVNLHHVRQVVFYGECVGAYFGDDSDPSLLFKSEDESLGSVYRDRLTAKMAAAGLLLDMDNIDAENADLLYALRTLLHRVSHEPGCQYNVNAYCTCWRALAVKAVARATGEEAGK